MIHDLRRYIDAVQALVEAQDSHVELADVTLEMVLNLCANEPDLHEMLDDIYDGDMNLARQSLPTRIVAAKQQLASMKFPMMLYRGFTKSPNIHALGKHWSTSKQIAKDFSKSTERRGWLLQITATRNVIDWPGTVTRSIMFMVSDESEVNLLPNQNVRVIQMGTWDQKHQRWLAQAMDAIGST